MTTLLADCRGEGSFPMRRGPRLQWGETLTKQRRIYAGGDPFGWLYYSFIMDKSMNRIHLT
jgi:hypothetical protein